MRSLWLSLLLLLSITIVAAADSFFICRGIEKLETIGERMASEEIISPDDCERARRVFDRYRPLISVSVSMDAVDGMENALLLLESAAKNQSAAEGSAALVSYRYALYRLRDAAIPSLETVF